MKAEELPEDDELRRLIYRRFRAAVGAGGPPYVSAADVKIGTKPEAAWRRPALFAVNDLRAEGYSISEALHRAYLEHSVQSVANSTFGSFKRSYETFRHKELSDHFYAAVLDGDLDEAIAALRFCHDRERRAIWNKLTKDSPPMPTT